MKNILTSDCKRAIYIGTGNPVDSIDSRPHALSYGMTGYYDSVHKTFNPDGSNSIYHAVPEEYFKLTMY